MSVSWGPEMPRNSFQPPPLAPNWAESGHLELEIKLLGTADRLDRIRESTFIEAIAASPPSVRHLHNVYYDTPDRWFAAHALTLRVRSDGGKYTQGLKARFEATNGVFRRWEVEREVFSAEPDINLLKTLLAGSAPAETLARIAPIFETRFTRTQYNVDSRGDPFDTASQIAVAFDVGAIVAGARMESIAEIELELIAGPEDALRALAARLMEMSPLNYGRSSKAQRGYRLVNQA